MVVVVVIALGLTGCVADPAPQIYNVTAGNSQATVSWSSWPGLTWPPVAYVVTPWVGSVRQTPTRFNSTNTDALVTGLTNGVTYTFSVHAINSLGSDSAESERSNPVTPMDPPVSWTIQTTPTCPSLHGDSNNGGSEDVEIDVYSGFGVLLGGSPVHVGPGQPYVLDLYGPHWSGDPEFWPNSVNVNDLGTGADVGGQGNLQGFC